MYYIKNSHIAVWFSCGAASAVAAYLTLAKYGLNNRVSILNNPIEEEHSDNQRFCRDVSDWLDTPIQSVRSLKYPDQSCISVWETRRFMSGPLGAPCTQELKKVARQEWESINKPDYTVLGFTAEETTRADRFRLTERDTLLTPLIDHGFTKQDCFDEIMAWNIRLPEVYKHGMPNANCIGCVKASSPTYWNLVRKEFPEVFQQRAEQSRDIGARLVRVKNERIFLDELDPETKGRPITSFDVECGLFCEEDPK